MKTPTILDKYKILSSVYFLLRDTEDTRRERLLFHVRTGDYFALLATTLGFIEEALVASEAANETQTAPSPELTLLRDMKKDLIFLNANYEICAKTAENTEKPYLIPDSLT